VAHRNLSETFRLADTGNGCHRMVTAESRIAAGHERLAVVNRGPKHHWGESARAAAESALRVP
jgi:hypothetical protein